MNDKEISWACIFLFHSFFVYIGDNGSVLGRVIQALCLFLFIVFFNKRVFFLFHSKDKKLIRRILYYFFALLITSLLSISVDKSYLMSLSLTPLKDSYTPSSYTLGIMIAVVVLMYYSFIEYLNNIHKVQILGKIFFKLCLFYCVVADLVTLSVGIDNNFFIGGGKFGISYLHLFLVVFYYLRNNLCGIQVRNKNYYYYILYAFIISIYTECTTALIGSIVLFLIFKYKKTFSNKIFRPKTMLCILIFCALFPFIVPSLIYNPIVSYIIVDILGEDLTLTGRLGIYETLNEVISLRPIWGWGIGNGHYIMSYLYGTANAQNGVFNLVLEQGIVGFIVVIALWTRCLYEVKYRNNLSVTFAVYSILLVLITMSMVEITIDTRFIVFTSFLLIKSYKSEYNIK